MGFQFLKLFLYTYAMACGLDMPMSTVVRQQYGVVFSPQATVDNSVSRWHHTFAYRLEHDELSTPTLLCRGGRTHESIVRPNLIVENDFCPTFRVYNERIKRLTKEVKSLLHDIDQLLPVQQHTRSKRGLVNVVGKAAKFLFGLSTEHDTKIMSDQIRKIREASDLQENTVRVFQNTFQSVIKQISQRQSLLEKGLELNRKYSSELYTRMNTSLVEFTTSFRDWINIIHVYGLRYTDTLTDLRHHLAQELQGIQTLLDGYLPVNLVPPHSLQQTVNTVSSALRPKKQFSLAYLNDDMAAYYKLQDISYHRQRDYLFITLKIPIASTTTTYTVYRVHAVPLRLSDSHNDESIILFDEPYLAISNDRMFYFTMSESEFKSCQGNVFKKCAKGLAVQEFTHKICALAIFFNDAESVNKLCEFTLLKSKNEIRTRIITIAENHYLISTNDLTWIQACSGSTPVHVKACSLCQVKLPCACSLKAKTFFIPATLHSCNDTRLPETVIAHNYQALINFYGKEGEISNLTSAVEAQRGIKVKYPEIDILETELDNVISQSKAVKLSLGKTANAIANNQPIYADKVSSLIDQLGFLSIPEANQALQSVSPLAFIGTLISLTVAFRNLYVLTLMARPASSFPWDTTTHAVENTHSCIGNYGIIITLIGTCTILIVLVIVSCTLYCRATRKGRSNARHGKTASVIKLVLFGENDQIAFPLKYLPLSMSDLYFSTEAKCIVPQVKYHKICFALDLDWSFVDIKIKTNGKAINLPGSIPLGLTTAWRLRKVLSSLTHLQLLLENGKEVFDIRTWSPVFLNKHTTVKFTTGNESVEQVFISPARE